MDKFCKNCEKYLDFVEIDNILYKSCNHCNNYKEKIEDFCISTKKYKNIESEHLDIDNKVKNINILKNPINPTMEKKCKKCKKINKNSYVVKYINNHFKTIYTCKNCLMNFF